MKSQYENMASIIDWIVSNEHTNPSLSDIAVQANLEPTYFQKIFTSYVGVSPHQFLKYMKYQKARDLLAGGHTTLATAYDAGLSGNARLHDLMMTVESVTPGDVKSRGQNLTIKYGFAPTFLGELMVAKTAKGICWLGFRVDESQARSTQRMKAYWPRAQFIQGDVSDEIQAIENIWHRKMGQSKLVLDIYGTNMQIQIWQALLKIPFGYVTDYKSIAQSIDRPKASRAVGNAVGANPISLLIPCHRVIQASGVVNNYGWGSARKKVILGLEGHFQ